MHLVTVLTEGIESCLAISNGQKAHAKKLKRCLSILNAIKSQEPSIYLY